MKLRHLKKIRIGVSLLIFTLLLLFFLGIESGWLSKPSTLLLRLQLIPSILRFLALFFTVSGLGFVLILLLTFLFGRVYCSSICPLGTLQDGFIALGRRFKSKKKRRFFYSKNPNNILRYSILGATIIFWFFGSLFLVNLLDPYSNFGKISVSILQPAFLFINNKLGLLLEQFHIYSVAPMEVKTLPLNVLIVSSIILLTIGTLSIWRGRLFCNTLCPAGSLLGLVSRKSFYKITFKDDACTLCGKCERVCKAECLDSRTKTIDHSRCISCFNCFTACSNDALFYSRMKPEMIAKTNETSVPNTGKRKFLLTLTAGALSLPLLRKTSLAQGVSSPGMIPTGTATPVTPPGSLSIEHFTNNCIACYLCVGACPTNVIVPSFFDYGLEGFMQPKLDYHKNFCNFDCVKCTEVCPTGAITRQSPEQKQTIQMGVAHFLQESCIVTIDRTDCGACSEHCPTKAVHMVEWEGLRIPEVRPEICVGCGACEYACPTQPYKAIFVESNSTHLVAVPIEESEGPKEDVLDDFPF
ncbi:MAG: 4Fe-4S dicluster domain-containing protein [Bacteroides sp.]|jgi:ferredoxin|nr:4Fe-4S dicluster domain-containing protein [Bacteroides sp.]